MIFLYKNKIWKYSLLISENGLTKSRIDEFCSEQLFIWCWIGGAIEQLRLGKLITERISSLSKYESHYL